MNLPEKKTILFTLVYKENHYPVQASGNEYHCLMTLISDHLGIPDFGLCSGMGSCGTCMVTIRSHNREERNGSLSCGIAINDDLANTEIIIPEGYY